MRKTVISILSVLLMLLLSGCGRISERAIERLPVTSDSSVSDIPVSNDEMKTTSEAVTTTAATTSEATTAPEPVTSPATTTEATTTTESVITKAETATQATTTAETTAKATTTAETTAKVTVKTEATTTVATTTATEISEYGINLIYELIYEMVEGGETVSEYESVEDEPVVTEPAVATELVESEPGDVDKMAQEFLELLNLERAKAGLLTLATGPVIQEMAQIRANELPASFGHIRPNGLGYDSVLTEYKYGIPTGYFGTYFNGEQYEIYYRGNAGETVGRMSSTHPEVMIEEFRDSAGHWRTLMDPTLGAVGVAVTAVEDQTYGCIYYYEVLLTDRLYE